MRGCRSLTISRRTLEHIARLSLSSREEVGFLLGTDCRAVLTFPLRNTSSSPYEFTADPLDVISAHNLAEALGLQVLALYHTHPFGGATPSQKDVQGMGLWPIPWLIVSPSGARAWALVNGELVEVPLDVVP